MSTYKTQITNKFDGRCGHCNKSVGAGQGFARIGVDYAKWTTVCRSCAMGNTSVPEAPAVPQKTFPLTSEQEQAVALFAAGESIAIEAGAGTGKTSTLVAIAKSTSRKGQYVAFNRNIVLDSTLKLAGTNCSASTAHSLAFQQVGHLYKKRLDSDRQSSAEIARRLEIEPYFYAVGDEQKVIQPAKLASYVVGAVNEFCKTADVTPGPEHMPYIDGIDAPDEQGHRTYEHNDEVRNVLHSAIRRYWTDIVNVKGQLRFNPAHYMKIWELGIHGKPVIAADYILFDEAQDASPVLVSAVEQQGKQIVYVGDSQQAIYEWTGAINALANVAVESQTFLTNSFRFGPEIAKVANAILAKIPSAKLRLVGRGQSGSVGALSAPDCILTRTNAGALTVVLDAVQARRSVHLVGNGEEIERFAKAARDLQQKGSTTHPELSIFTSWTEVEDYVANDPQGSDLALMVSLIKTHGIPAILKAVSGTVSEEDADLIVSTAHKSKGREWDKVQLHGDFAPGTDLRLLYVACTRARLALDFESCGPVKDIMNGGDGRSYAACD